jgi:hypothetical protein
MPKSVISIATSETQALDIIASLRKGGFPDRDISILRTSATGTGAGVRHDTSSKAPEGASVGAVSGGAVGGTIGVLAGIGLLAIPGLGPFIAAGPILAALSGAAVGAAVGGVTGGLIGLGVPEIEAKAFEAKLHRGELLVAVHAVAGDRVGRAKEIFKAAGAHEISVVGEEAAPSEGMQAQF